MYELRRGEERLDVQPKVLAFLRLLAQNANRTIPKDEILDALWPDVAIAEASLQRIASLARHALTVDDDTELIRTVRGVGYGLMHDVEVRAAPAADTASAAPAGASHTERIDGETASDGTASAVEQEIRFCRTVDGVNVAWARSGTGPPLVRSLGWFTNLEMEWRWPAGRRFWEKLSETRTLVRYDGRGMGLSDTADEFTLETRLRDFEAVVEAAGLDRLAIIGISEGCSVAIRYAARNPERVSHLVLFGTGESSLAPVTSPERIDISRTVRGIMSQAWGNSSPVWSRFMASLFMGTKTTVEMADYFGRMQRASADRETALHYFKTLGKLDVSEDMKNVKAPTLVIHETDDQLSPFWVAREVAARIPDATLEALDGDNHWLLQDDPESNRLRRATEAFLSR